MKKTIFIISGPSGVWKTTLWEYLKPYKDDLKIEKMITITTRKKRENEIDWKDYYFVSPEKFGQLIKNHELVEWAEVHNNFYWSSYQELERILNKGYRPIYIVDPQWVRYLKKVLSDKYNVVTIFILPPSIEELKKRLFKRWEDPNSESYKVRLQESLIWLNEADDYDYRIVNDDIENASKQLKNIIKSYW